MSTTFLGRDVSEWSDILLWLQERTFGGTLVEMAERVADTSPGMLCLSEDTEARLLDDFAKAVAPVVIADAQAHDWPVEQIISRAAPTVYAIAEAMMAERARRMGRSGS